MKVKDPDGQTWRVTRRWLPWRRRMQHVDTSWSFGNIDIDDGFLAGVVLFFLAPVIVLALIVAAEFLLLLLLLPLAVLGRALFGKAWTIEARRGFEIVWDAPAGDWQTSGLRIHEVADEIRRGRTPPAAAG